MDSTNDIGLLLAYADEGPIFEQGMDWSAAAEGPKPEERATQAAFYPGSAYGDDPNDLEVQRWGVVVPDDEAIAKRLLGSIDPLVQERKRQQGAEPVIYRVPRDMGPEASSKWWRDVYQGRDVDEADRPRYLLILGDADLVSWDLQQRLAVDLFAGRLAFQSDDGYASYASKVLAYERREPENGARALFYTVRDGSQATSAGHAGLMEPTVQAARDGAQKGTFHAKEIVLLGDDGKSMTPSDLRAAAADPSPAMLFSISHGLGSPRTGWSSPEEQRRFQGSMSLGGGQRLTYEDVASRPFLPGGAWFYFACFGAGTPSSSAYHHWLAQLKQVNLFGGSVDDVLRSLPASGQPPFVSRMPQAALANPEGPTSIVGHVDLAWTFSFQEYVIEEGRRVARNRPSRFQDIFRQLVAGKRMGAGYAAIQRHLNIANSDLTTIYDREESASARGIAPNDDVAEKLTKATLWMERQDLAAYVLLGDPAARLNVARAARPT